MNVRIGRVTNIYPSSGRVKVVYKDENNASLPLSMLTMNNEYSLPAIGERVVTLHMENGSSKGFVLGTYYGGGSQPRANSGYRKDFTDKAYAKANGGTYLLSADDITLSGEDAEMVIDKDICLCAKNIIIQADDITLECSAGTISVSDIIKRLKNAEDRIDALSRAE